MCIRDSAGAPDAFGRERYARFARFYTGADVDLEEAYAYGWAEFHRLLPEMHAEAARILPGAGDPWQVLARLGEHGRSIEGAEETRRWLQALMDEAADALDGTHFDIAAPVRRVESCIAPPGGSAAPYYTQPSLDFSRPGRTWLPTLGRTRFPLHNLVSTWYHEGLPGHHLQLGHWTHIAGDLSRYQTKVARVSATTEGWVLYAEHLMDELGFLTDPQARLGHLDAQMMRALRVVTDIGLHLRLTVPGHAPLQAGERWTPAVARDLLGRFSGRPAAYLDSEVIRYLGRPGQAITYKLGERAWLQGREAARAAQGPAFDLKRWHMAALSLGSLGASATCGTNSPCSAADLPRRTLRLVRRPAAHRPRRHPRARDRRLLRPRTGDDPGARQGRRPRPRARPAARERPGRHPVGRRELHGGPRLRQGAGVRAFSLPPGKVLTPLQRHLSQAEMHEAGWIDADGNPADPTFKTPEQGATDPGQAARLWALSAEPTGVDAFATTS